MSDLSIDRKWRKYFGLFTCKEDNFSKFLMMIFVKKVHEIFKNLEAPDPMKIKKN